MEPKKTEIIEKAAKIIQDTGLEGLTVSNLATELEINESQLYKHLTKDDDIVLILLLGFETDIIQAVNELANNVHSPETELKLLFKRIYLLFLQKPYYLSIIFDKNLKERDESIKKSFVRIRNVAESYLTLIIDKGKSEYTFKTNVPTRILVDQMLSSFRILMKDEQSMNEMVLQLKTLRKLNN
ncbi:hypothetical protein MASR2M47_14400 [Draconibacterium sp.]|jgi:AcrR family transcriptional regulator